MGNKKANSIIIILFLIVFTSCSQEKKVVVSKDENDFEIHFQDHFLNDTLSLKIGSCKILDKQILKSNEVLGVTKFVIIAKSLENEIVIKFLEEKHFCPKLSNGISLGVILNSKNQIIEIDLSKGKYIGLSNSKNDSLVVNQSKNKFYYY